MALEHVEGVAAQLAVVGLEVVIALAVGQWLIVLPCVEVAVFVEYGFECEVVVDDQRPQLEVDENLELDFVGLQRLLA